MLFWKKIMKILKAKSVQDLDTFTLCEHKSEQLWIKVSATIQKGSLIISGHDFSSEMMKFCSGNEYEYWYSFDQSSTERLIAQLVGEDRDIKNLLYEHFSGLDGCKKLREFCNANGIKYKFNSWSSD